ncbi:MAG: hypothetical protein IJB79_03490 [Candidatus Gastranaerophilales bacterium]|nr:hypothetical protein [Candidatus Gastranaerophilales bacterium]
MTFYNVDYFQKRTKEMEDVFNVIKPDLQELADYFLPRSVQFISKNVRKPIVKNKKILDSTPLIALRNFSSGMMSGATSPTNRWFKTVFSNIDLANDYYLKNWCAKQEELTRRILYSSNFYQCLPEVYKQLGVFGFCALGIEPDFENVVNFRVLPLGSYFYARNSKGKIDTFCRKYMETAKNIVEKFGNSVPKEIVEISKENPLKQYELIHFVEKNKYYKEKHLSSKFAKYISAVILSGKNEFLSVKGFNKFPYIVFESSNPSESDYPHDCPGVNALADVKQLMTMVKEYAKAVKKIVCPTYKGPASLKNKKLADVPGAYIEEDENGRGISPVYEVNPRVLELKQEKDELKQAIKEHFYNDLFAMILNTAERGRTATEVNELKEEKMVLLSPLLEQIHCALREILKWIYDEQIKVGIIEPLKPQYRNCRFQIEFVSSLAQAQKVSNISSMERFTTFVSNIANAIDPVLKSKLNGEKIIEDYAAFANISPTQIVPSDEIEKLRNEIKNSQNQQIQMNALKEGSQIIQNMGGVDSYGSDLLARFGVI